MVEVNFTPSQVSVAKTLPTARYDHTSVMLGKTMYIFGGYDGSRLNDLWKIDLSLSTPTWSQVSVSGTLPPVRHSHTSVMLGNTMYIFGGSSVSSNLNDLWKIDLSSSTPTWSQVSVSGTLPEARYTHTAVVLANSMYVFGGVGDNRLNDLWRIDLSSSTPTWTQVSVAGTLPPASYGHTAVALGNTMYVFGGYGGSFLNDLWAIDLLSSTPTWSKVSVAGTLPTARNDHTSVVLGNNMYVFGGYGGSRLNELWRIDLSSSTPTWSKVSESGTLPTKRYGHTTVVLGNSMYIFGGVGGDRLNDLCKFSISKPPATYNKS